MIRGITVSPMAPRQAGAEATKNLLGWLTVVAVVAVLTLIATVPLVSGCGARVQAPPRNEAERPVATQRTEAASGLPVYRARDTVEAYEEYLRSFPNDPGDDLDFARTRLKFLRRKGEEAEIRQAELDTLIRLGKSFCKHPKADDPQQLYERLIANKARQAKGEFEKTDEYNRRLKETEQEAARDADRVFILRTLFSSATYDADRSVMRVAVKLDDAHEGESVRTMHPIGKAIPLSAKGLDLGPYVAGNAFGAVVNVSRKYTDIYGLVLANTRSLAIAQVDPLGVGTSGEGLGFDIPMDREMAIKSKLTLAVFAAARLASPYTFDLSVYTSPSFHEPEQRLSKFHYLNGQLLGLWACDTKSGRLVGQMPAQTDAP
jgi:hypothetical protein